MVQWWWKQKYTNLNSRLWGSYPESGSSGICSYDLFDANTKSSFEFIVYLNKTRNETALSIVEEGQVSNLQVSNLVVEISNPQLQGDELTYNVRILEGEPPATNRLIKKLLATINYLYAVGFSQFIAKSGAFS